MSPKFAKPEGGWAGVADDELEVQKNYALDEYSELVKIENDEITDDQLERLEELKGGVTEIKGEQKARDEAAEERNARLDAAKAGIDEDEDEADPAADPAEEDAKDPEAEEEPAEEKEDALVASAARRQSVSARAAVKRRAAQAAAALETPEPAAAKAIITVAPDVKGFAGGSELDGIRGLAEAFKARTSMIRSVGRGAKNVESSPSAFGVATIKRPLNDASRAAITETDTPESTFEKIMNIAREARSFRGEDGVDALTAAAYNGWVTPSENLYELCQWATFSGGLTLPSITVRRGGINFTKGIDFSAIFNDADGSFIYTEAQMIARPTKPMRMIQVPTWQDIRLDSIGMGAKAPIPLRNSFPELLDDYMEKSLVAYQKYVNRSVINRVLASLGSVINAPEYGGSTADLLQTIEMIRLQFIQKYSLADNQVLEFMFPSWIKSHIRAELSRRSYLGIDPFNISDAQIESWFRTRGIRTQYVKDWEGQDLNGVVSNLLLRANARFGVWVPGTFVRGGDEIIRLDAIYDQANLEKNEYIAAFFEESLLVANTCGEGALYELHLNPYGLTGANVLGAGVS